MVTAEDAYGNTAPTYAGMVSFATSDTAAEVSLPAYSRLSSGVGTFTATFVTPGLTGITVTDTVKTSITGSTTLTTRGLVVTSFAATPSGFTVSFNKAFVPSLVNLYTTGTLADDAMLTVYGGPVISVHGSVVFNSTDTGFTFVKTAVPTGQGRFSPTAGLLAAGNYTLTLRAYTPVRERL